MPMSDVLVNLGATEQKGIYEANTSLADSKRFGPRCDWEIPGQKINGQCKMNGKGQIAEFGQDL